MPLEPKPRSPRSLADSSTASTGSRAANGVTSSWAIRSPGSISNSLLAIRVEQQHPELAAVAGVDQPGCVDHRDAVTEREPGARQDEAGVTGRDLDRDAGADRCPLAGSEQRRLGGAQVEAGIAFVGARRQQRAGLQQADLQLHPLRQPIFRRRRRR